MAAVGSGMAAVTITVFTDPMMGLSYESEPVFRRIETHFKGRVTFQHVMSGLVRSVYDLVDPTDMRQGKAYALERYRRRLARIYEEEEKISGMPINMSNFRLFSTEDTSSLPLNQAYKAVQLTAPLKADLFLYRLRFATVVECRPTTRLDEIMRIVRIMRLDEQEFLSCYRGEARGSLEEDLALKRSLSIRSLPAYLVSYGRRRLLIEGVTTYNTFVQAVDRLSDGTVTPEAPVVNDSALREFLTRHPLISPIEVQAAFDLGSV